MPTIDEPRTTERLAGDEPIPGYILIEPLGRGGFGEVWKCVAPGGLHKAVKFVPTGGDQFRQEAAAFERIRAIRHAFLMTLERVESVGNDLVMVMELADAQLQDRFDECRRGGGRGIPRDELLRYMSDAAEALDVIAIKYGLQHLDVKPANLFLIDGHVKVGDYGLVRVLGEGQATAGLTPKYAAPEVLKGHADVRSDQYSLALVYHELLTGSFPYPGRTLQQLMLQHVSAAPDLSALPAADQTTIARALAKAPADRFASCIAFVRALRQGPDSLALPYSKPSDTTAATSETQRFASGTLVVPQSDTSAVNAAPAPPVSTPGLAQLPVVVRMPRLRPRPIFDGDLNAAEFIEAVVAAARIGTKPKSVPVGTRSCRFLCTTPEAILPKKLLEMAKRYGMEIDTPELGMLILRREVKGLGVRKGQPGWLWVSVCRAGGVGPETFAMAGLDGDPNSSTGKDILRAIPGVLSAVRGALENLQERRAHERSVTEFPVRIHPIGPDGSVGTAEDGLCEDVSSGGVRILTRATILCEQVYLEFRSIEGVAGLGLLANLIRIVRVSAGHLTACRFVC